MRVDLVEAALYALIAGLLGYAAFGAGLFGLLKF